MDLSRRGFLEGALGSAVLLGLEALPAGSALAARGSSPSGTTLDETIVRGPAGAGGYVSLVSGPGEPYLLRGELAGIGRHHRSRPGRVLGCFEQLTDVHVVDAQSPARVEFFDPYGSVVSDFRSAYRPQELLSTQVGDAMIRRLRQVRRGPSTGRPIEFAIVTGDNTDNCQFNELRWYIDLLDGNLVRPDSGDLTKYEGVMDDVSPDPYYWHPESGFGQPTATYGFPTVPGLLDAARAPFRAAGVGKPWFTAYGNHDGLVQGNVPRNALFQQLSVGPLKPTSLPPSILAQPINVQLGFLLALLQQDPSAINQQLSSGGHRFVTPDPDRRIVDRITTVTEHFNTTGHPVGHGFTRANLKRGTAYYTFNADRIRGIVLDTVVSAGGADGSIDATQFAWLEAQLQAASSRWLSPAGDVVSRSGRADKLFVIFSHHTVDTMTNLPPGSGRVGGAEVAALLLRYPNVIAWVNGHTHRNQVIGYPRPKHMPIGGGFWELNTAAHIDYPEQSRIVEVVENHDNTLSIFGTIVDHAGGPSFAGNLSNTVSLAALSRELAANDWQERTDARRGGIEDRNVELLLPAPFRIGGHASDRRERVLVGA